MLAIDLPGRGRQPADLEKQSYGSFVASVEHRVRDCDLHDLVIVAHSMGGLTAIGLMNRVPERIRHVVFVTSPIPAEGESIADLTKRRLIVTAAVDQSHAAIESGVSNLSLEKLLFHDLNEVDTLFCMSRIVPESMAVYNESVDLSGLKMPISRTYVRTLKDRGLPPELQAESISRIPRVRVREMDTGHTPMFANPNGLANIIMECH